MNIENNKCLCTYHIESLSDEIETILNGYEQKEAIYAILLHFFVLESESKNVYWHFHIAT